MTRIAVSEHVLRWVVDRSGNFEAIEQRFPKLRDWMSGESHPTLRQVEQLSRVTATPLGYFFLQEPPVERLPIPHFRTLQDSHIDYPSPNLLETVQMMERRQAWMSEYLIELGQEPLKFVRSANIATAMEEVASEIRHTLGLVEGWSAQQPTWSLALRDLQLRI